MTVTGIDLQELARRAKEKFEREKKETLRESEASAHSNIEKYSINEARAQTKFAQNAEKCLANPEKIVKEDRERFIEAGKKALEEISRRFFYIKDKLYVSFEDDIYQIKESTLESFIEGEIPSAKGVYKCITKDGIEEKEVWTIDVKKTKAYIQTNAFKLLHYVVDPFSPPKVEFDGDEIRIYRDKIRLRLPPMPEIPEYNAVVSDYMQHFPLLTEFLDFVAACRFSESRKRSFLYLRCPSDWGKSFLFSGILETLGVGLEMRYSDFAEDRPVGIDPIQIQNSFVLAIDEFKYFPSELKRLTHTILVEPKFGFRTKVEVYAKIFLSAEQSESFTEGVDAQIRNRVIVFDLFEYDSIGKLTDRKLYTQNSYIYKKALTLFFYTEIKRRIDEYLALGQEGANVKADAVLNALWEKFKITEDEDLIEKIKNVVIDFLREILAKGENDLTRTEKEIIGNIYVQEKEILITKPARVLEKILQTAADESFWKKAKYKKSELRKILGGKEKIVWVKKLNTTIRAYVLPKAILDPQEHDVF